MRHTYQFMKFVTFFANTIVWRCNNNYFFFVLCCQHMISTTVTITINSLRSFSFGVQANEWWINYKILWIAHELKRYSSMYVIDIHVNTICFIAFVYLCNDFYPFLIFIIYCLLCFVFAFTKYYFTRFTFC